MKKIVIFSLLLGGIAFTSCKKDFVCHCTVVNNATGVTEKSIEEYSKLKRNTAISMCEEKESSYTRSGLQAICDLD